jgi:signal transduction histidine kinase
VPLVDESGNFAGFRGSATRISGGWTDIPASEHPEEPAADTSIFGERIERALRDPLDHIITHAETIGEQGDGPLKSDYAGYAADIASASKHLLTLVDDLVDLQAVERPDFKPASEAIDIAEVARQAAHLLSIRASERNVSVSSPDEDGAIPVLGEFRRALQIVVNLLTNAIRYSPEGGEVAVSAFRKGAFGAITVSDAGKGIDPADQARVFEKFERVDPLEPGGTGLGLYIARRLARAMGGDLTVESAPDLGSTFTLTLPLRT